MFAARFGKRVEASLAIVIGYSPFGANPILSFEALQGGIKSAVIHQQLVRRGFLNGPRDALTVLPSEDQGAQDQQVQRALQERQAVSVFSGSHLTQVCICLG